MSYDAALRKTIQYMAHDGGLDCVIWTESTGVTFINLKKGGEKREHVIGPDELSWAHRTGDYKGLLERVSETMRSIGDSGLIAGVAGKLPSRIRTHQ